MTSFFVLLLMILIHWSFTGLQHAFYGNGHRPWSVPSANSFDIVSCPYFLGASPNLVLSVRRLTVIQCEKIPRRLATELQPEISSRSIRPIFFWTSGATSDQLESFRTLVHVHHLFGLQAMPF